MAGRKRSRGMTGLLFSIVRIAAAVYIGLAIVVYLRQAAYVYFPTKDITADPAITGLVFEDIRIPTTDGETLAGWFVPAPAGVADAPVILFCHGNGGNIGGRVWLVQAYHTLGLAVLIFDYRGYGESTGKPSEAGTYTDAAAAWDHLVNDRDIAPHRIIALGRSLGGAVAVELATRVRPGALVVESSFTSARDMAAAMFPFLPIRWLCRFRYDNLAAIGNVHCPVLIAHSRSDEAIPFEHGVKVYGAANTPKEFLELNGGHNESGIDGDAAYREAFAAFLRQHVGARPAPDGG